MKKYQLFIGIDVSKHKLDVCIMQPENNAFIHRVFENTRKGIVEIIRFIRQQTKAESSGWMVCLEHTGVYAMPLCCYLSEEQIPFALVPAIQIQRSLGVKRGKSDKADSKAIARYVFLHQQEITCYRLPEKKLLKLKLLLSHRERLMKSKKMFEVPSTENELYLEKSLVAEMLKDSRSIVRTLKRKIKQADAQIHQLIQEDDELRKTFQLIVSVPGIGIQTACHLLVTTRCFTAFETARQLACYAGVAPFEYSSGISIKGRSKVSPLANKKLKSLLSMGALNAVRLDKELNYYYQRKKSEGKNAMLVLNAVRNKLISRVFATVKRGTPYVQMMNYAA